jgi:hypothetical protein
MACAAAICPGWLSAATNCGQSPIATTIRFIASKSAAASGAQKPWAIDVPEVPDSWLALGVKVSRAWLASFVRGGDLDFEGITCDSAWQPLHCQRSPCSSAANPTGPGQTSWLKISPMLGPRSPSQWHVVGQFNALFEGLAINPEGDQMWLGRRTSEAVVMLLIKRKQTVWDCDGGCVLLSEAGKEMQPEQFPKAKADAPGFCRSVIVQWQAVYPRAKCVTRSVVATR